ncbi:MAG TPA: hypothetical protein VFE07_12840 [Marmoricola sp.]|jgi:hypothetical protein|nr:hypothetical protein [Marmoricola sp.]
MRTMERVRDSDMAKLRIVLEGLLVVGLLTSAMGWYLSSQPGANLPWGHDATPRFESCTLDDQGNLVLTIFHGVGKKLTPSVDFRGREVVVSLDEKVDDGPRIAIGLTSTFRVATNDGSLPNVRYADGKRLSCAQASSPPS